MQRALLALGAVLLVSVPSLEASTAVWRRSPSVPTPRTEVAAAVANGEAVVVGGFLADGSTTGRAEAYSPRTNRWRRLPDLPAGVNHAASGAWRGRMIVAGGYSGDGAPASAAWLLERGRWRRLAAMPENRAAAAGAVAGDTFYVVGGVTSTPLGRELTKRAFALDLTTGRWRAITGPTPREHLAAAAWRGRVYALGGRLAGYERISTGSRPTTPPRAAGAGSRRCPRPAAARAPPRSRAGSSPWEARRRAARCAAPTPTTSPRAAGAGSPTCPRRATGSASSRSAAASASSRAARAPA
jgi:hypothetical protein